MHLKAYMSSLTDDDAATDELGYTDQEPHLCTQPEHDSIHAVAAAYSRYPHRMLATAADTVIRAIRLVTSPAREYWSRTASMSGSTHEPHPSPLTILDTGSISGCPGCHGLARLVRSSPRYPPYPAVPRTSAEHASRSTGSTDVGVTEPQVRVNAL